MNIRKYLNQNNIPSQELPKAPAFDPRSIPDLAQTPKLQARHTDGTPSVDGYVVPTYDSRLIGGKEFQYSSAGFANLLDPPFTGQTTFIGYPVPAGYIAVIRQWSIDIGWGSNDLEGSSIFDQYGNISYTGTTVNIDPTFWNTSFFNLHFGIAAPDANDSILVGLLASKLATDIQEFSPIPIMDAIFGPISGDTFIIVPENQIFLPWLTGENSLAPAANPFISTSLFRAVGNLIPLTGRAIIQEISGNNTIPTKVAI